MFHQGTLQSGISLAIQQQKLVACFIHSPSDSTSRTWEDEYLTANTCSGNVCGQVGHLIAEKAVLLKIELGSQEAGFLNAFCPVEEAPAVVVIRDGRVLERIAGGVAREEFVERLGKAVGLDGEGEEGREGEDGEGEGGESDPLISSTAAGAGADAESNEQAQPSATPTQPPEASAPQQQPPNQANTLLAERARRLEAERLRHEAAQKAERLARKKAREEEAAAASRHTATTERNEQQKARDAWIYQQKQRKDEVKKEKERVLQQIESDKQERKAAALRRKEGAGDEGTGKGEFSEMLAQSGSRAVATGVRNGSCALQIRLFDGSSIKGKFAADADLATAVRTWVREASPEGGADIPYSFRQILAPQPSRSIEVGEEGQTLQDLGLAPSATLVLVPVAGGVDAYEGSKGVVGSAVNGAYWLASTAYSFSASLLGAIPGFGSSAPSAPSSTTAQATDGGPYMAGTSDPQDASNARGADMAGADSEQTGTKMRVKTLADQRAEQAGREREKEGAEFYNGNSSAFQGDEGGGGRK